MKKIKYIFFLFLLLPIVSKAERVLVITLDEGIGPSTNSFIESSIERAYEGDYEALLIKLNTPGGLLESTRDIVENIMEADIPIIVYVSPSGARAGSAGVFITLSAHIAAMAPGTNIGAAHPVGMGGQSDTTAMFEKITNDAAAFVRTIAEERGKNVNWAELTVRESISSTATEALEAGAIDLIATSVESLLESIDSTKIETKNTTVVLNTSGATIDYHEKNWKEELLSLLSDPNIAYIFLMLGFYGIVFELYSPGSIFPGALGAISILIGAYSMQMLPVNYAGLGLIIVGFILFVLEVYIVSYGLLSIGGTIGILLGSIMLIDSPFEFMDISMSLIITVTALTALFFIWIIYTGVKAQFHRKSVGGKNLSGEKGKALSDITPGNAGTVYVHGENWKAVSMESVKKDDRIIVNDMDGFTLIVKKVN
jgi:membrane-bound serine protease (ClpP class)